MSLQRNTSFLHRKQEHLTHFCRRIIPTWSSWSSEAFYSIFSHVQLAWVNTMTYQYGKVPLTLSYMTPPLPPAAISFLTPAVWEQYCSVFDGTDYRARHMADLTTVSRRVPSGSCGFLGFQCSQFGLINSPQSSRFWGPNLLFSLHENSITHWRHLWFLFCCAAVLYFNFLLFLFPCLIE